MLYIRSTCLHKDLLVHVHSNAHLINQRKNRGTSEANCSNFIYVGGNYHRLRHIIDCIDHSLHYGLNLIEMSI